MFKNKKVLILGLIAIFVLSITSLSVAAFDRSSDFNTAGKLSRDMKNNKGDVVVNVDGEKIYSKDIELSKMANPDFTDEQIKNDLIADKILLKLAEKKGIEVGDNEIDQCIAQAKEVFSKDNGSAATFKSYIEGLGVTEAQYWQDAREAYKNIIKIGKLKASIQEQFVKDNNLNPQSTETQQKFLEYYRNYIKGLIDKNK